jgi:alkylation response protein AidB-like acyl-CoA dehydrogenase
MTATELIDVRPDAGGDVVDRVTELAPMIASWSRWSERHRRIAPEVIEALADAGVYRLRVPREHGGLAAGTGTLLDVADRLARADGAVAWTVSVHWNPTWIVGLFPAAVREEVFSLPNVRVCGSLTPSGILEPVDGGYRLTGRWAFVSGAWHGHWQQLATLLPMPDGTLQPVFALAKLAEMSTVDDWYAAGLTGSGSISTLAKDVFIPAERVLPLPAAVAGLGAFTDMPSEREPVPGLHGSPLLPVAAASSVGTLVGMARGALECFTDRLPGRSLTYTDRAKAEAPVTHLRIAEAAMAADEAEFHARRMTDLIDGKAATAQPWSMAERAWVRGALGAVCARAKTAVDVLATAAGGSSLYRDVPIQRIWRDVQAVNLHAFMHARTSYEVYGRVLCGLPPNTAFI